MESLGDLAVTLRANTAGWEQGMASAAVATQAFANRTMVPLVNVAAMFRTVGVVMFGVGAAGAFAFTRIIKPAIDFQDQMAQVATMVDDTGKHMGEFADGVTDLSIRFGEATDSLSKGLYDILSATIAPSKALKVLEVSARAAAAGMTDTGTAADAVTTMLNAFQLSADRAEDVADLLFAVVRRGKTTFDALAPSIGRVAAPAALAGLTMEEMGASLATITRAGIPTRIAVTSLASVIKSFLTPTEDAQAAARELGLVLSTATLRTKGLTGVLVDLAGMQPELVGKIFPNVRALRAMAAILQGATGYAYDYQVMLNRAGMMSEAFAKRTDTLTYSINRLKQAGLALVRTIAEQLLPDLKELSDITMAVTKAFTELDTGTKRTMAYITAIVPVVALLTGAFLLLLGPLTRVAMFLTTSLIPAFIALAATPQGLIVALIALGLVITSGIGIYGKLRKMLQDVRETMEELTGSKKKLRDSAVGLGASVTELLEKYKSLLAGVRTLGSHTEELKEAKEDLMDMAKRLGPEIMSLTSEYIEERITLDELNESLRIHIKLVEQRVQYEEARERIERYNDILAIMRGQLEELRETPVLKPGFWGALQALMSINVEGWEMLILAMGLFKRRWGDTHTLMEKDQEEIIARVEKQIELAEKRVDQLIEERMKISERIKVTEEEVAAIKEFERLQMRLHDRVMDTLRDETTKKEEAILAEYSMMKERYEKLGRLDEAYAEIEIEGVKVRVTLEEWKNLKLAEIRRKFLEKQAALEAEMVEKARAYYIGLLMDEYRELEKYGKLRSDRRREIESEIFDYAKDKTEALIELAVKLGKSEEEVLLMVRDYWSTFRDYVKLTVVDWTDFIEQRLDEASEYYEKTFKKEEDFTEKWYAYLRLIGEASLEDEIERIRKRLETEKLSTGDRIKLLTKVFRLEKELADERKRLAEAVFAYQREAGIKTLEDEVTRLQAQLTNEKLTQVERYKIMTELVRAQEQLSDKRKSLADKLFEYERLIGEKSLKDEIARLRKEFASEELTAERRADLRIQIANLEKRLSDERKSLADKRFQYEKLIGEKTVRDEIGRLKERLKVEKMTEEERYDLLVEIFNLEKGLSEKRKNLIDKWYEYQRALGEETLEREIERLQKRLEVEETTEEEYLSILTELANKQRELAAKRKEEADKWFEYQRLIGDKTLEDEIARLEKRLMTEELTQTKRAELEIQVFNLEKKLASDRKALADKLFEYLRLTGEKSLEDEIERVREALKNEELSMEERVDLWATLHDLEEELADKRIELAEKVFQFLRLIGGRTLEDEIRWVEERLAREELSTEERIALETRLYELDIELEEKREKILNKWFEYQRLTGEKTLEDEISRIRFRLENEELSAKERLSLLIELFNLEKKLEDERRNLADKRFEYLRLTGEKSLEDEIARVKLALENEKLTQKERIALQTELFNLEKKLADERIALAEKQFEYTRKLGLKSLEDEIVRQAALVRTYKETGKTQTEIIDAQLDLYQLLAEREKELIKLALERGETNAQIYARLVELWKKYAIELGMSAEEAAKFISGRWEELQENFDLVGETIEERWSIAMDRMKARVETWFVSVHRSFEGLGEIVGNFFEQWSEGLSEALVLWVKKTEDMEKVWQKMWQKLIAYALDQLLKLLAMAIVKFILRLLGLGAGAGATAGAGAGGAAAGAGALKGGLVKLKAGGLVGQAESLASQYFQQLQEGGEVLVRAHLGEWIIPKWMTDFIRRTESVPGELVQAIVAGRPPRKFQEGGLVREEPAPGYSMTVNFLPGSKFTEVEKASTRAWFESELWPLHEEFKRRS